MRRNAVFCAALTVLTMASQAFESSVSTLGVSGSGITPASTPLRSGQVVLGYDNLLPGRPKEMSSSKGGHHFALAIGLPFGAEVSARLATNDLNCNAYGMSPNPCREPLQRDLAASFKIGGSVQIKSIPGLTFSGSLGATDLGGAATNYRGYYALVGAESQSIKGTLGYGRSENEFSPLRGSFGSLAWKAFDGIELQAERAGRQSWIGAKLTVPKGFKGLLREGVNPYFGVHRSLSGDEFTKPWWSGFGVDLRLGHPGQARDKSTDAPHISVGLIWPYFRLVEDGATSSSAVSSSRVRVIPLPEQPSVDLKSWASTVASHFARNGFEDISVGLSDIRVLVKVENSAFQHNELDALGIAMGLVSSSGVPKDASGNARVIDLVLTRHGVIVYRVKGSVGEIADWLQGSTGDVLLRAGASAGRFEPDDTEWLVQNRRGSIGRSRLFVSPDLDYRVGTEYGTLDISAGIDFNLQAPLWRGATADVAYVHALGQSGDYKAGREFSDFSVSSQLYRVMLHQFASVGPETVVKASAGYLFKKLRGASAEVRWLPGDGRHSASIETHLYKHSDFDFEKKSTIASYRYFQADHQVSLEAHGGKFWHGDRGALAAARFWMGDKNVTFFLRRSRFDSSAPALYSPYGKQFVNSAGFEVNFPLTPRKEHVGDLIDIRGQKRFGLGVASVVGKKTSNYLTPYFGRFAPIPLSVSDTIDNMGRGSQAYLDSNHARVREAWSSLKQ